MIQTLSFLRDKLDIPVWNWMQQSILPACSSNPRNPAILLSECLGTQGYSSMLRLLNLTLDFAWYFHSEEPKYFLMDCFPASRCRSSAKLELLFSTNSWMEMIFTAWIGISQEWTCHQGPKNWSSLANPVWPPWSRFLWPKHENMKQNCQILLNSKGVGRT